MAGGSGPLTVNFDSGLTAARVYTAPIAVENGFSQASEDLARIGNTFGPMIDKALAGAGKREGQEAADAQLRGEKPEKQFNAFERFLMPTRADAAETAYLAGIKSDIDARETQARTKFAFDPEGYKAESQKIVDGFISGAPSDFAFVVADYARGRTGAGFVAITGAKAEQDVKNQKAEVLDRVGKVDGRIEALIARDGLAALQSPEGKAALDERQTLYTQLGTNPAFGLGPDRAAAELADAESGTVVAAAAADIVRGADEYGYGEAEKRIQRLIDDPALPLSTEEREQAVDQARERLTRMKVADNQERADASAAVTAVNAARTKAIEDDVGLVELTGEGNGLTSEEILKSGGTRGDVAEWYRKRATALESFRLTGDLAQMTPDQASAQIAAAKNFDKGPADSKAAIDLIIQWEIGPNRITTILDDNGRGVSKYGINQSANPDVDVSKLTREQAADIYKRKYWDSLNLDALPKGLALVVFDAAVVQGQPLAQQWLNESGGDIAKFNALRLAHFEALAVKNPARYGDDLKGWRNRVKWITRQAAAQTGGGGADGAMANFDEAVWQKSRPGFVADPLGFAREKGIAPVPALDLDAMGTQEFRSSLQARSQVSRQLVAKSQVPPAILTNAEAKVIADRIEADPVYAITFARSTLAAVGAKDTNTALRQVGQNGAAGVTLHIADLSINGSSTFADAAAQGVALKDRDTGKGLSLAAEDTKALNEAFGEYQTAFGRTPALFPPVRQAADAAMLFDRTRGIERPPSYYVQGALGSTRRDGNTYGGAVKYNGAAVILPNWLGSDMVDDSVRALANFWKSTNGGPIYSNGARIPPDKLAKYQLVLQPDGRYAMKDPKTNAVAWFKSADGKQQGPYLLDFDGVKPWLNKQFGVRAVRYGDDK